MDSLPTPTCTTKEFADFIGRTVRWVQRLVKEGHLPSANKGRIDTWTAIHSYISYLQSSSKFQDGIYFDIVGARARYERAKAEEMLIQLALTKGEAVYVKDVKDEWMSRMANFRARMLAIPSKIAMRCCDMSDSAEIEAVMTELVEKALLELDVSDTKPHNLMPQQ